MKFDKRLFFVLCTTVVLIVGAYLIIIQKNIPLDIKSPHVIVGMAPFLGKENCTTDTTGFCSTPLNIAFNSTDFRIALAIPGIGKTSLPSSTMLGNIQLSIIDKAGNILYSENYPITGFSYWQNVVKLKQQPENLTVIVKALKNDGTPLISFYVEVEQEGNPTCAGCL